MTEPAPVANATPAETGAAESHTEPQTDPTPTADTPVGANGPENQAADPATGDPATFPRDYVEQLRRESASYRERAGRADQLAERLLETTVRSAASSVLADPGDLLHFGNRDALLDGDGMPDADKIVAAARELVTARPHLASRRPSGDAGQGARRSPETVDLAGLLRQRAG